MSVPRPGPTAYQRRLHENRLRAQVDMARAALRRRKWQLMGVLGGAALFLAAAGAALAIALDRVFR